MESVNMCSVHVKNVKKICNSIVKLACTLHQYSQIHTKNKSFM